MAGTNCRSKTDMRCGFNIGSADDDCKYTKQDIDMMHHRWNLTDEAFEFFKGCHNLKTINLSGCTKITDAIMFEYLKHCDELQYVDFSACNMTDAAIKFLVKHCPKLQSVNFTRCKNLTDDVYDSLNMYIYAPYTIH